MQRSGKLVRGGTGTKTKIKKGVRLVIFFLLDVEIPGSPGKEGEKRKGQQGTDKYLSSLRAADRWAHGRKEAGVRAVRRM